MKDHDKWLKKYKHKLIFAWKLGFDDQDAAERVGISIDELNRHLAYDEHLREARDRYVDELRRIARDNIAEKIMAKDRQACEWYLEKTDPRFGAKSKYEDVPDDYGDGDRRKVEEALDEFMKTFKDKGDLFDGN